MNPEEDPRFEPGGVATSISSAPQGRLVPDFFCSLQYFFQSIKIQIFQFLQANAAFSNGHFSQFLLVCLGKIFAIQNRTDIDADVIFLAGETDRMPFAHLPFGGFIRKITVSKHVCCKMRFQRRDCLLNKGMQKFYVLPPFIR